MIVLIGFIIGPQYGHKHVMIYISLCSAIGSLTVMACKALGIAIKEFQSKDPNRVNVEIILTLLAFVIICIIVQMNYLNKALDLFNTNIVTPSFYVCFTTLVLIASAILFKEWQHSSYVDIAGCISGCLIVVTAIFFLTTFKNTDISIRDLFIKRFSKQESSKNGFKPKYGTLYPI